jgi:hypothetical protein
MLHGASSISAREKKRGQVNDLIPQSLVPEMGLGVGQIIYLSVHGSVEDELGGRVLLIISRPVQLVICPFGVGVTSQDERQEVLLHFDGNG